MTVTDIEQARRRRERISEVAHWAMTTVPFTMDIRVHPDFSAKASDLTASEVAAVGAELGRRTQEMYRPDVDLEALAAMLSGRYERYTRAANWMIRHPGFVNLGLEHDFLRHFSDLTTSELMLATIEAIRRCRLP